MKRLAERYAEAGLKVTAAEYYRRAQEFYSNATLYAAESAAAAAAALPQDGCDVRQDVGTAARRNFERVQVTFEGKTLRGFFRKPGGAAGTRFPVVIGFQGADSMAHNTILGGAGSFVARGMAYLVVDVPGQGWAMRVDHLALPPDTERVVKVMVDYLETRPDVDASRIAHAGDQHGRLERATGASGEPRIKAVVVASGSLNIGQDLFHYYPPIQERVRWIIGARDLPGCGSQAPRLHDRRRGTEDPGVRWSWAMARTTASWTRRAPIVCIRRP